jgi:hypothetical protein
MPYDPHSFEEEGEPSDAGGGRRRRFREFDCPECSANNPHDDGFGDGDVVLCHYCGEELQAEVNDEGVLRLVVT